MDDQPSDKARYPSHDWGALARDPWMKIESESEEQRQVLRRYWVRNGGDGEFYDRLVPPVKEKDSKRKV